MKHLALFILTLSLGVLCLTASAHAGPLDKALGSLDSAVGEQSGTGLSSNLPATVGTVVRGVLALVGTIFFVLTIYAGILWMTAMGNSEQLDKSRSIITAAVIGLAITLSAYAITYFVGNRLTGSTNPATFTCSGICLQNSCGQGGTTAAGTCQAGYICCSKPQ